MAWVKLIPQFWKGLTETVKLVEVLRGPGNGADKKAEVMEFLQTMVETLVPDESEAVVRWASAMIDVIVAILKATGVFK